MELIGKINSIFTINNIGDVIVTGRIIVDLFNSDLFPSGTRIELRGNQGKIKQLHIKSAELSFRDGKDYLSFILQEQIDKQEIKLFDEVWCLVSLEQSA